MIHHAAEIVRSMMHDPRGDRGAMIHDGAGIGRSMIHHAAGGLTPTPE
jgi:hypothetical protein